jgi:uncharacterized protein with GYD domain
MAKHAAIERLKLKLDAAGIVRTVTVTSEDAAATITALINRETDHVVD